MIEEKDETEIQSNDNYLFDDMSGEHAQDIWGTLKRFLRDLLKQKWQILAVMICLAASAICSVLSTKVI